MVYFNIPVFSQSKINKREVMKALLRKPNEFLMNVWGKI